MKNHKLAITVALVLVFAVAAYASPIFGTWKGELNGRPITVTVTYNNAHTDVAMAAGSNTIAVSNANFPKGGPPLLLHFQTANQSGQMKLVSSASNDLSYELQTSDGQEATLRVIDQGKTIATVKMTKTSVAK